MTKIIPFDEAAKKKAEETLAAYRQVARERGFRIEGEIDPIEFMTASDSVAAPREYIVADRILPRQVTLFAGPGGVGKSILMLQLLCAAVMQKNWLGFPVLSGPVIYLAAEDEQDEIQTRIDAIAYHYGTDISKYIGTRLFAKSYAGEDMTLARFPRKTGICEPTPLCQALLEQARDISPRIIVLDTLSDIFGGDENNRTQVAAFVALLRNLAMAADCAVIPTLHPSATGAKSGDGTSGSTAWHGKVRGRMYMRPAVKAEGSPDMRVLEFLKNQYGGLAEKVTLRFQNGLFVPVIDGAMPADEPGAEQVFLTLLDRFTKAGRNVSDKTGTTFAPALFAVEKEAKALKLTGPALTDAMNRLFASAIIRVQTDGPPSKPRTKIVRVPTSKTST